MLDPVTLDLLGPVGVGPASRYLFSGHTGRPLRPDNLTDRFNELDVAAQVRPIGPHQIRHLIASTLLDAGYGVHEVAEPLGHDPATLMRYDARVNAAGRLQASHRTRAWNSRRSSLTVIAISPCGRSDRAAAPPATYDE